MATKKCPLKYSGGKLEHKHKYGISMMPMTPAGLEAVRDCLAEHKLVDGEMSAFISDGGETYFDVWLTHRYLSMYHHDTKTGVKIGFEAVTPLEVLRAINTFLEQDAPALRIAGGGA